jgi:flagellar basal-body rod protein FlgB
MFVSGGNMDILFNKTMDLLSGMLDYRSKRHKIILSNIANIDTDDFKPSDISFNSEFGKTSSLQMTTTDSRHIGPKETKSGAVSFEINTSDEKVKIDTEMANLAENHLMYNMTVDMMARKFRGINTVLKETK